MNDLEREGNDILTGQPARGRTLAEILAEGPLAPGAMLRYAILIGKALGRVHEAGVVHGNLSPRSIVIGDHGATVLARAPGDPPALAYNSPEQIGGDAPDFRSDVFAFGAILFEMAAGRPAFSGGPEALRAAIVQQSPPKLPAGSPVLAAMEPVIADCLDKDPRRRRQRLQNVVTELKLARRLLVPRAGKPSRRAPPAAAAPQKAPPPVHPADAYWLDVFAAQQAARRARILRWAGSAALLIAVAAAGLFVGKSQLSRRAEGPVLRFSIAAEPQAGTPLDMALSPDGRNIAYTAEGAGGRRMLWVRALSDLHARIVAGTDDASEPFWSADSSAIGYFANRSLKVWKLQPAADGTAGESKVLCPADTVAGGGTWNAAGVIVFAPSLRGGLYRISAGGGDLQVLLPLSSVKEHRSYRWPHFLPDGRHFTFLALGAQSKTSGAYSGDLESRDSDLLFASDSDAVYSGELEGNPAKFGYLLFVEDGDVYAQGFNPSILEAEGKPQPLLRHVGAVETLSRAPLAVSSTGLLAYQTVGPPSRELVWMDRDGKRIGTAGEPADWGLPRIAPDGKGVVCSRVMPGSHREEIWLVEGGAASPLVSLPGADARSAVWSPDGARIAFAANSGPLFDIYLKNVRAPGAGELLFHSEYSKYLTDWSRDGRYLLFASFATAGTASDAWAFSLTGRNGGAVVNGAHAETYPALSPDGRWLAYQSSESGRDEIYVRPFEGIATEDKRRWKVSAADGRMPRWRADGRELFFLSGLGSVMAAATSSASGQFTSEAPRTLFEAVAIPKRPNQYDVSGDGQRFLMNLPHEGTGESQFTVVTNWMQELGNR